MKAFSAVTLALILSACSPDAYAQADGVPVTPTPDGGATFKLTREQWVACQNNGGCAVIPITWLEKGIESAVKHRCGKAI